MAKINLVTQTVARLWKLDKNFFANHHPNDLSVSAESAQIIDDFLSARGGKGPGGLELPAPPECGCVRAMGKKNVKMSLCKSHHGMLTDFFAYGRRQEKNRARDIKRKMADLRARKKPKHDVFTSGKVVSGGAPGSGKKH